ncbi:MAG: hypothetical protein Q8P84_06550 [Deltaproteobacteria bacterium]|nr:hypothetical protein [Deltaproteobacteria bacterium]
MSGKEKLLQQVPLMEFFKERVSQALVNQHVPASDFIEFYLANLLQEFKKTETFFEKEGDRMSQKPLALILADAAGADLHTKIRCLKKLGDLSLYTAGFFGESINRKIIDIDYYIGMGGSAYMSLSAMLQNQKTFAELYLELAELFPDLVDVLAEVAATAESQTNENLLKLYERWLETGSEHLENLLKKAGITLPERNSLNKPQ